MKLAKFNSCKKKRKKKKKLRKQNKPQTQRIWDYLLLPHSQTFHSPFSNTLICWIIMLSFLLTKGEYRRQTSTAIPSSLQDV